VLESTGLIRQQRGRVQCGRVQACVAQLWARGVDLEAVLLKPMMVMAGGDSPHKTVPEEVARLTLDVMRRCA
jgi:fructose-bisphosphate aldolase class 1